MNEIYTTPEGAQQNGTPTFASSIPYLLSSNSGSPEALERRLNSGTPSGVHFIVGIDSGGLRVAATSGYSLATLLGCSAP